MAYRVGVDIGGTFTDFCVFDEATGGLATLKVLSRPDRPGAEVSDGLAALETRYGIAAAGIADFTHGTTVGVNTVLQRKGIRLCLFATRGFEDVLELARLKMPDPYDLFSRRPEPLIGRERVFAIDERTLVDGGIDRPLDEASVTAAIAGARRMEAEGIVVALLHAYANPRHEQRIAEIIAELAPDLSVTLAHRVWPVIREYERTVTATVAGYVQPRVAHYLDSLQQALRAAGVPAEAMITKSNGGVMTAELAKRDCAQMLLSGTAAGVIGAASIAAGIGARAAMSLDVGGTSADVAVIRDGVPQYGTGETIGDFPIFIPTVAVTSIGEGGGSIARIDAQGVLKVGPESAGADPGPACYGQGGSQATLTDACVVAGLLGGSSLGYSAVDLHPERAAAAVGELAAALDRDLDSTAEAIVQVAVSGMFLEVSKLVSRHGIDPRELSLIAFGGAGPMLACYLARELSMRQVVIPRAPGVLSAFGGLIADIKNDFIRTLYLSLDDAAVPAIRDGFAALREQAVRWIREDHGHAGEIGLQVSADMRYRGQSFEVETPLRADWIEAGEIAAIADAFHATHAAVYEHSDPGAPVQIINLRLVVVGVPPKPAFAPLPKAEAPAAPRETVEIFVDGARRLAQVYWRGDLLAGHSFDGPAIVRQDDCTTLVLAGFETRIDPAGNLILERGA